MSKPLPHPKQLIFRHSTELMRDHQGGVKGHVGVKVESCKVDIKLCVVGVLLLINVKTANNTGNGISVK